MTKDTNRHDDAGRTRTDLLRMFAVAGVALLLSLVAAPAVALQAGEGTEPAENAGSAEFALQPVLLIQLAVADLDRAIAFYRDILGLELESRMDAIQWARIKSGIPNVTIGLGVQAEPAGSGTVSMNFGVGNIERARATLEERGVVFDGPTVHIPGVVSLADFRDPDGNRLRLAGHPSGQKEQPSE